ncbi:MAG TPA: YbfB/YjiJ family MFS transporter [Magnetospirillum sp.]|jgi:MFS family permease|nr:YbfB/YjiJ family MFS transporter [Magnetospirillum sp.]
MAAHSGRILVGGLLALAVALGLGRFAFTPILPVMQAQYGFDAQGSGWLAASNNVGYLIGALWAGWARTDAGRHRLLALGFVLLVATLALMPATASPVVWNVLRLIAGIASAWIFVLASALVVPLLTAAGHARWTGFHFGGVGFGIILAGLVVGWVVNSFGSDAAWLATAAMALVMALLSWPVLAGAHVAAAAVPPATPSASRFPMTLLAAAYFCEGLGYIVTGTFLVAVVRSTEGLGDYANLSWVLVGLAALPSAAAWSFLAEKHGHLKILVAGHVVQAVGVALPALSHHPAAVLLGAVMYGGTFLGIVGMSLAFGRALNPAGAARIMGLLTAVFGIGQIIGPVLAAHLAATGGWGPALLMAAGVVLLGAPLLLAGEAWARRGETRLATR